MEWYDSSKLKVIDSCHRKAYWSYVYQLPNETEPGIEQHVGPGAHMGSCLHVALAVFSDLQSYNLNDRRARVLRAFLLTYAEVFPNGSEDVRYTVENGIRILDNYLDTYNGESSFTTNETELAATIPFPTPAGMEPFEYTGCIDAIWQQIGTNNVFVVDHKSTSGSVDRELDNHTLSRQCEGYQWMWSQLRPDQMICGYIINAIGVHVPSSKAKPFSRQVFFCPQSRINEWVAETIEKVEHWRTLLNTHTTNPDKALSIFDRNTNECTTYGSCPFKQLCLYGINGVDLRNYSPNRWHPLTATLERAERRCANDNVGG